MELRLNMLSTFYCSITAYPLFGLLFCENVSLSMLIKCMLIEKKRVYPPSVKTRTSTHIASNQHNFNIRLGQEEILKNINISFAAWVHHQLFRYNAENWDRPVMTPWGRPLDVRIGPLNLQIFLVKIIWNRSHTRGNYKDFNSSSGWYLQIVRNRRPNNVLRTSCFGRSFLNVIRTSYGRYFQTSGNTDQNGPSVGRTVPTGHA